MNKVRFGEHFNEETENTVYSSKYKYRKRPQGNAGTEENPGYCQQRQIFSAVMD